MTYDSIFFFFVHTCILLSSVKEFLGILNTSYFRIWYQCHFRRMNWLLFNILNCLLLNIVALKKKISRSFLHYCLFCCSFFDLYNQCKKLTTIILRSYWMQIIVPTHQIVHLLYDETFYNKFALLFHTYPSIHQPGSIENSSSQIRISHIHCVCVCQCDICLMIIITKGK